MATMRDTARLVDPRRAVRPLLVRQRGPHLPVGVDEREMARHRVVEAGVFTPAAYQPGSAEWTGGVGEGSAIAAAPLLAAVVPAEKYLTEVREQWTGWGQARTQIGRVAKWEAEIFRMMRVGPGFVGTASTMYANWLSAGGRLVVQERAGRDGEGRDRWEACTWEPAVELLRMWRGEDKTQQDLMREVLTLLDSVGQCYQALRKTAQGEWVYDIWAHSAVQGNAQTGMIECRGVPEAGPGSWWFREYLPQLVDHLFIADDEWKGRPTSQMQRVLGDIYRFVLAERSMDRDLMSRLRGSGILWSKAKPGGKDWTPDFAQYAGAAYSGAFDDDYVPGLSGALEEVSPYLMITDERPEYIELARDVSRAAEVRRMAWEAICIGLDMPKGAMDGNEAASRWSGFLNRDEESLKAAAPRMQRLAAMVQRSHFEPWFRRLQLGRPLSDFRVWYELPDVRPERTAEKITLAPTLIPTRTALAETVGWSDTDLAELPDGMSEFEAGFLLKFGRTLAEALAAGAGASRPAPQTPPPTRTVEVVRPLDGGLNEPGMPTMPTAGTAAESSTTAPLTAALPDKDDWWGMVPR